MIVWGGTSGEYDAASPDPHLYSDGAVYDPVSDSWRMIPDLSLEKRHHVQAV
jgi:hypothetical protein